MSEWSTKWILEQVCNNSKKQEFTTNPEWQKDATAGIAFTKVNIDANDTLKIEHIEAAKVYLNKVPTHDPYTNPNAHIYFECSCGKILDPGTKSFAALTTHASKMGWKIRWGQRHYIAYCNDCGKSVE